MNTKYAIQIAYDGTDFCGWQVQCGVGKHENPKPSIEGCLIEAIRELCGATVTVTSSGRTDAGVHSSGQVAHFALESDHLSEENLRRGLNFRLPPTIQIHQLGTVPMHFNAKQSAAKQYSYYFQQGPVNLPHLRNISMWNRELLDGNRMLEALRPLIGTHDFAPLGTANADVSTTVRQVSDISITREPISLPGCFDEKLHHLWRLRIAGTGFLKQMVRRIAGTLKQIGEGQRPTNQFARILETGDTNLVGPTAPAGGLWLDRVWYEKQDGIDCLHFLDQK